MHEVFSLFWSWCGVLLHSPISNFSYKKHSAAIFFPLVFCCKTIASALDFLQAEIIRPSSRIFSQPYAVLHVHACMEKVNAKISIFLFFNFSSFCWVQAEGYNKLLMQ